MENCLRHSHTFCVDFSARSRLILVQHGRKTTTPSPHRTWASRHAHLPGYDNLHQWIGQWVAGKRGLWRCLCGPSLRGWYDKSQKWTRSLRGGRQTGHLAVTRCRLRRPFGLEARLRGHGRDAVERSDVRGTRGLESAGLVGVPRGRARGR